MFNPPETYPWDYVFDGDRTHQIHWSRNMPWKMYADLHDYDVRTAMPDHHWSGDVKHWGGEDSEDQNR